MKISLFGALLSFALLITGCNFGGPAAQYEGLYTANGSSTLTWAGGSMNTPSTGHRTLAEGLTSDLIYADEDCAFTAEVEGKLATLSPSASCTISGDGYTQTMTVTSGILNLSETTISVNLSGTFTVSTQEGSGGGSFVITETLTRKSK